MDRTDPVCGPTSRRVGWSAAGDASARNETCGRSRTCVAHRHPARECGRRRRPGDRSAPACVGNGGAQRRIGAEHDLEAQERLRLPDRRRKRRARACTGVVRHAEESKIMKVIALSLALVLAAAHSAAAFCGFYVSPKEGPLLADATQ